MATWHELQNDFTGGEVSSRMFMRDDMELHGKAALVMSNFMPTHQGSAIRTPGTRFLWEIKTAADAVELEGRIFPYITPDNQYALVEVLPDRGSGGEMRIRQNITEVLSGASTGGPVDPDTTTQVFKSFVPNDFFQNGSEGWTLIDPEYASTVDGARLGWWVTESGTSLSSTCRDRGDGKDKTVCTITNSGIIPEDCTQLQIAPVFQYINQFSDITESKITGVISVGTTPGGAEIFSFDFSDFEVGQQYREITTVTGTFTKDDPIYLTFTYSAVRENGIDSTPAFLVDQFRVLSPVTVDVNTETVVLNGDCTVDWTPADLQDVHFVQSPYNNSASQPLGLGNEIIFTHPNYPPKRLYFNAGQYILAHNFFANQPTEWAAGQYPATCTSHMGRLVLAGCNENPTLGSLTGSLTERVWTTEVGKWDTFTDPNATEVNPDDSIEFTSTFRSPIQWVQGQQALLIGAESMEYVATADGIFQPSDLGVAMHSTHGSAKVQPVPMGNYVLFAAEQGYRVRAMQYIAEAENWVAPDMNLYHPDLFADTGGIVRMARMRNPHQMCACVMRNGQIALLHQDSYANIHGWSRMVIGDRVKDIVVLPQENGVDAMYILVRRNVGGVQRVYLEVVADWTYQNDWRWNYTNAAVTFVPPTPTNVITGLDHLEGRIVQVVGDYNYLGSWEVSGGQVTLTDGTGAAINVSTAIAGIQMTARLFTMPLIGRDPSTRKRYANLSVRVLNSSAPLINGVRPPERKPTELLGRSQWEQGYQDYETSIQNWTRTSTIDVQETLPIRTEILGIFGKVGGSTV